MAEPFKVINKTQENVKRDQEIQKFVPIVGGIFAVFFIVTLVIVAMGADKEKKVIRPKVEDFFSSFDRKDYGHLYEALFCESFKANTGRVKFLKRFAQASDNLGTLRKRNDGLWKTGTAAGVPVYTIEYRSEYAKGTVEEVLSFTKENGTWCVSDYGGTKPGSATGA